MSLKNERICPCQSFIGILSIWCICELVIFEFISIAAVRLLQKNWQEASLSLVHNFLLLFHVSVLWSPKSLLRWFVASRPEFNPCRLMLFSSSMWRWRQRCYFLAPFEQYRFRNIILVPEKFLSFDWPRAEVFQLTWNNYSYYGNPKSPINLVARAKMAERFLDFEIRRFKK